MAITMIGLHFKVNNILSHFFFKKLSMVRFVKIWRFTGVRHQMTERDNNLSYVLISCSCLFLMGAEKRGIY